MEWTALRNWRRVISVAKVLTSLHSSKNIPFNNSSDPTLRRAAARLNSGVSVPLRVLAIVMGSIALAVAMCVIIERAQARGVCFSQLRFVTAQERIESAARYNLERFPPVVAIYKPGAITFFRPRIFARYKGFEDFLTKNPDCCAVGERGDDGWQAGFQDRLFGLTSAVVHLRYSFSYRDPTGKPATSQIDTYIPVSSCGISWDGS